MTAGSFDPWYSQSAGEKMIRIPFLIDWLKTSLLLTSVSLGTSAGQLGGGSDISAIDKEIVIVANKADLARYSGEAFERVLDACSALAQGKDNRILDAADAYNKQFGKPLRIDSYPSEEATKRAHWLRDWLSDRIHQGGTIVLLGDEKSLPIWQLNLEGMQFTTDSLYGDLDGDGVPETSVCRIVGPPEIMIRQLLGKSGYNSRAIILCSEDTRIHLETRAFAKHLAQLGYDVSIRGAREDEALTSSDFIIHFGHGDPSVISNRFGEAFVTALSMPALPRSPIVFVDGCGTLPVGSPLLNYFLKRGALGYLGSTATVQGMIPARFTNELVEHFLRIMKDQPNFTLPQILVGARAAYVRGHSGLAEKLRQLALTGTVDVQGDEVIDMLTVAEWVYYGDPRAVLPRVAEPKEMCREVVRLTESTQVDQMNRSWQCSFTSKMDDGQAVLAVCADIPLSDRADFKLSVRQNHEVIANLDSQHDTRYQNIGRDCRGGYAYGDVYRARFLIPFDHHVGKQDLEVRLDEGSSAHLMPGTGVDIWPAHFEKMIGLKHAPNREGMTPAKEKPVEAVGVARLHPTDIPGFLSLDLSSFFNRPHDSVEVGGGDNASFKTWFTEDAVSADGVPFRVVGTGNDVLVSANNTQNIFEMKGFETRAHRVHFLLWGYNIPRRPAALTIHFKDGSSQACSLPLSEWTDAKPPIAFDFENTRSQFRHAAIVHRVVRVEHPDKEIVRISSSSGMYGVVAVTIEE